MFVGTYLGTQDAPYIPSFVPEEGKEKKGEEKGNNVRGLDNVHLPR